MTSHGPPLQLWSCLLLKEMRSSFIYDYKAPYSFGIIRFFFYPPMRGIMKLSLNITPPNPLPRTSRYRAGLS